MKRSAYALIMALFLTALGLAIFAHKVTALDIPFLPAQAYDTWSVEARLVLDGDSSLTDDAAAGVSAEPTVLSLYVPQNSERYTVLDESFEIGKFEVSRKDTLGSPREGKGQAAQGSDNKADSSDINRAAILSGTAAPQERTLFYRATVRADAASERTEPDPSTLGQQIVDQQVDDITRETARVKDNLTENFPQESVDSLIQEARNRSSNDLDFARAIYQLSIQSGDNRVRTLQETLRLEGSSVELTAFLLNEASVVARTGNGILLNPEEAAATDFAQWLEVNRDRQWFAYDPVRDRFGAQTRYLTWWYGTRPILTANGSTTDASIQVTARPDTTDGLGRSVWHDDEASFFLRHSFVGLPLSTQRVIQVLVMIPIGALVVAGLHQMVGFRTFGTFTPVLIALSFRETGLLTGVILFGAIVIIGVCVRGTAQQSAATGGAAPVGSADGDGTGDWTAGGRLK